MKNSHGVKRTLLLGGGPLMGKLLSEMQSRPRCKYQVVDIVIPNSTEGETGGVFSVIGTVENLHWVLRQKKIEVIVVEDFQDSSGPLDHQLLEAGLFRNIRVEHATDVFERLTGKLPIEAYAPDEFVYTNTFQPGRLSLLFTRLISVVVAFVGSILLAPILLLIAGLIKLDSDGPALFIQERSGLGGKPFRLLKFRSMQNSDQRTSEWAGDNVHRITRVGHWLRKFRLDELPQFLNILQGDMNIVGPRPHPVSNFELFLLASRNTPESGVEIPYYSLRSRVRPGITGWAQVRYRYANNLQEEIEKLRFDLYYIKHYSLALDMLILLETIKVVFAGSSVASNGQSRTAAQVSPQGTASSPSGS